MRNKGKEMRVKKYTPEEMEQREERQRKRLEERQLLNLQPKKINAYTYVIDKKNNMNVIS